MIRAATTLVMQNPISHPPIACSSDLFGAAAFALRIANTLKGAQRTILIAPDQMFTLPHLKKFSENTRTKNDPNPNRSPPLHFQPPS